MPQTLTNLQCEKNFCNKAYKKLYETTAKIKISFLKINYQDTCDKLPVLYEILHYILHQVFVLGF